MSGTIYKITLNLAGRRPAQHISQGGQAKLVAEVKAHFQLIATIHRVKYTLDHAVKSRCLPVYLSHCFVPFQSAEYITSYKQGDDLQFAGKGVGMKPK